MCSKEALRRRPVRGKGGCLSRAAGLDCCQLADIASGRSTYRDEIVVMQQTIRLSIARVLACLAVSSHACGEENGGQRPPTSSGRVSAKVQQEFDAVALQALLGPALATGRSGPFGSGSAGRHWQGLMAEHLARHIAASGQLKLLRAAPSKMRTRCRLGDAGAARQLDCRPHSVVVDPRRPLPGAARGAPMQDWKTTIAITGE